MSELLVGRATHYYSRISVMAIKLDAPLRKGDRIRIVGRQTDLRQTVESMEIDHRQVDSAGPGDDVAILVCGKVREGDRVYREVADAGAEEARQVA